MIIDFSHFLQAPAFCTLSFYSCLQGRTTSLQRPRSYSLRSSVQRSGGDSGFAGAHIYSLRSYLHPPQPLGPVLTQGEPRGWGGRLAETR